METCLKVGRHLHDARGGWAGLETRSRSDGVLEDQWLRLEIRRGGVGRSHLPSSFLWTGEQKKQPSTETTTWRTGRSQGQNRPWVTLGPAERAEWPLGEPDNIGSAESHAARTEAQGLLGGEAQAQRMDLGPCRTLGSASHTILWGTYLGAVYPLLFLGRETVFTAFSASSQGYCTKMGLNKQ